MEQKYLERICDEIKSVECLTHFLPLPESPINVLFPNRVVKQT